MRKAIRSVTHLDLALNAGSLFIKSFPLCARPAPEGPENIKGVVPSIDTKPKIQRADYCRIF
jgi:hypothetical protein